MSDNRTASVVAITGAGSGIGLAAALHYAGKGWSVGLIGGGEAALDDATRRVEALGVQAHFARADVADSAALDAAATLIEAALGPIDVWVNNAGIGFYGLFEDVPEDAFRRVVDVNLFGTINGTRTALARMRPRNRGTIVQILSAIAYRGVPLQTAYSATKYGLRGFTEALQAELVHERSAVQVTMVHPPSVNTPFYSHAGSVMDAAPRPPPPVYEPEMLGEAIYLAGTVTRREWVVGEQAAGIKLLNQIAPGVLDKVSGAVAVPLQKTTRQPVADRRDPNTFTPSRRAAGMHGPFDRGALPASLQWWMTKRSAPVRAVVVSTGFSLMALGALALLRPRR